MTFSHVFIETYIKNCEQIQYFVKKVKVSSCQNINKNSDTRSDQRNSSLAKTTKLDAAQNNVVNVK